MDDQELLLRIKSNRKEVHSSLTSALELLQKRSGITATSDGCVSESSAVSIPAAADVPSSDASMRRKQLVMAQAKALEADGIAEVQEMMQAVSMENAEAIGSMEITKDLSRVVREVEKNGGEWFKDATNTDQALRKVQAAWREAVERAAVLLEACTLPPADLETQMLESEGRVVSLQELATADATLALWEAEDNAAKQALKEEPTQEQLEAFTEANALALESFLSSEEELLGFLDLVYGETTARSRQESMRLLSKAIDAVDMARSEPAAPGEGEGLTPRSREEKSTSLMEAAKDALFEVAAEARQRAERFHEQDPLRKRVRLMQKEANAKGMRGDQVVAAAKMEKMRFTELRGRVQPPPN